MRRLAIYRQVAEHVDAHEVQVRTVEDSCSDLIATAGETEVSPDRPLHCNGDSPPTQSSMEQPERGSFAMRSSRASFRPGCLRQQRLSKPASLTPVQR